MKLRFATSPSFGWPRSGLFSSIVFALLCFAALAPSSASAQLVQGRDYALLEAPQPTDAGARIEVIEFFYYSCPYCNALDPALSEWVRQQGDKIQFKRVHVDFHGATALQRLYYCLEAMGQLDQWHAKVFHAVHVERQPARTDTEVVQLAGKLGIDVPKLMEAGRSFTVQTKMRRSAQLVEAYKIDGVPTVVVDGRYRTSPSFVHQAHPEYNLAQANAGLPDVLGQLVEMARAARAKK